MNEQNSNSGNQLTVERPHYLKPNNFQRSYSAKICRQKQPLDCNKRKASLGNSLEVERHNRVVIIQEAELFDPLSFPIFSEDQELTTIQCHPIAILLRFRVAQIVCGVVILLLGVVACLSSETRSTLSIGIPSGLLATVAAIAHIHINHKEFSAKLLSYKNPNLRVISSSGANRYVSSTGSNRLLPLRPFLPTFSSLLAGILLLSLSAVSISTSSSRNCYLLAYLLSVFCTILLITETLVWFYKYRWIRNDEFLVDTGSN